MLIPCTCFYRNECELVTLFTLFAAKGSPSFTNTTETFLDGSILIMEPGKMMKKKNNIYLCHDFYLYEQSTVYMLWKNDSSIQ